MFLSHTETFLSLLPILSKKERKRKYNKIGIVTEFPYIIGIDNSSSCESRRETFILIQTAWKLEGPEKKFEVWCMPTHSHIGNNMSNLLSCLISLKPSAFVNQLVC